MKLKFFLCILLCINYIFLFSNTIETIPKEINIDIEKHNTSRGIEVIPFTKIFEVEIDDETTLSYELKSIHNELKDFVKINLKDNIFKIIVDFRLADLLNLKGSYVYNLEIIFEKYDIISEIITVPILINFGDNYYDFRINPNLYYINEDNKGYVSFTVQNNGNSVIYYSVELIKFSSKTFERFGENLTINDKNFLEPNKTKIIDKTFYVEKEIDKFLIIIEYLNGYYDDGEPYYERINLELTP